MTTSVGPLHGYRVVDLADETAALCGKMFADLGADVVKVEPPGGCPTRSIPPFLDEEAGPDRSCYFQALAAGKRSVTLDIEQPEGRELLARLADGADFLVESSPPGYLDAPRSFLPGARGAQSQAHLHLGDAVRRSRAGRRVARDRHRRLGRERDDGADGRAGAAAAAGQCPAGLLFRGRGGGRREHAGPPGPRAVRAGPAGRDQPAGRGGGRSEHRDGVSRPGGALDGPQRPDPGLHAAGRPVSLQVRRWPCPADRQRRHLPGHHHRPAGVGQGARAAARAGRRDRLRRVDTGPAARPGSGAHRRDDRLRDGDRRPARRG